MTKPATKSRARNRGARRNLFHYNDCRLAFAGAQFPHRQFNSAELCVLSGIGRTAMSQIKNAKDTPFSLGKCTLQRLDKWLAKHPGPSKNNGFYLYEIPYATRSSQEHHHSRVARPDSKAAVRRIWLRRLRALRWWNWSATISGRCKPRHYSRVAGDTQAAQDAVDRELVVRYRPGQQREGLLIKLVERIGHLQGVADRSRNDDPSPALSAVAKRVTFPYDIWRLADVRWQDLGYRSLSAYVTGLIRYDLLVSGPHSTITADCRSKIQRALTRKTLAARRKGDRRKILLDHLSSELKGVR